jgi:hypothetical protein
VAVFRVRSQEVWLYSGRKQRVVAVLRVGSQEVSQTGSIQGEKRCGSIQGEKPRGVAVFRVRSQEVWLYSGSKELWPRGVGG